MKLKESTIIAFKLSYTITLLRAGLFSSLVSEPDYGIVAEETQIILPAQRLGESTLTWLWRRAVFIIHRSLLSTIPSFTRHVKTKTK